MEALGDDLAEKAEAWHIYSISYLSRAYDIQMKQGIMQVLMHRMELITSTHTPSKAEILTGQSKDFPSSHFAI